MRPAKEGGGGGGEREKRRRHAKRQGNSALSSRYPTEREGKRGKKKEGRGGGRMPRIAWKFLFVGLALLLLLRERRRGGKGRGEIR